MYVSTVYTVLRLGLLQGGGVCICMYVGIYSPVFAYCIFLSHVCITDGHQSLLAFSKYKLNDSEFLVRVGKI